MLEAGLRHVDIAEHLSVSRGTITRLAARYRVCGTFNNHLRSGRLRVTTPVQDCHICTSRHIYVIAFYRQCQLPWLLQIAKMTE